MAEKTGWKTREDVKHLTVGHRVLGSGKFGTVYHGRIWFNNQEPKRVAVKIFKPNTSKEFFDRPNFDEDVVGHYEEAIARLKQAGVPVLKTGFLKHKGEWAQVQELWAVTAGSKIKDPRLPSLGNAIDHTILKTPESKKHVLDIIGRIINAGLIPHPDTIGVVQTSKGNHFFVHDLDFLAHLNYLKENEAAKGPIHVSLVNALLNWRIAFYRAGIHINEFSDELKKRVKTEEGLRAIEAM